MAALVTLAIKPLPWRVPQFLPLEAFTDRCAAEIYRSRQQAASSVPIRTANKYPNIVENAIVGNESLGQNSFKTLLKLLFRGGTGERGVAGSWRGHLRLTEKHCGTMPRGLGSTRVLACNWPASRTGRVLIALVLGEDAKHHTRDGYAPQTSSFSC
jgi:hypothetical protein